MELEWYYILGIAVYLIFVIQTVLSFIGADSALDADFDTDGGFGVSGSDIISFKGLIHFAMGFSGWLMLAKSDSLANLIYATLIGITFMFLLYWVYKWCMKLSHENVSVEGKDLIGQQIRITYRTNRRITDADGNSLNVYDCYLNGMEVQCVSKSNTRLDIGSFHTVMDYADGYYFVD